MARVIDTLMTCAELALVLAGFSGIIVVLSRTEARWDPLERLRVTGLLVVAFGSLLFSLAPVALSYLQVQPDTVWRASSALMATYQAIVLAVLVPQALGDPETRARLPLFVFLWGSGGAMVLLQLANATFLANEMRFGVYFAGLALNLLSGGLLFYLFLFPPRPS